MGGAIPEGVPGPSSVVGSTMYRTGPWAASSSRTRATHSAVAAIACGPRPDATPLEGEGHVEFSKEVPPEF